MSDQKRAESSLDAAGNANQKEPADENGGSASWWHDIGSRFVLFQVMPSWLTSFLIHLVLIIVLALFVIRMPQNVMVSLVASEAVEDLGELSELSFDDFDTQDVLTESTEFVASVENELDASELFDELSEDFEDANSQIFGDDNLLNDIDPAPAPYGAAGGDIGGRVGAGKLSALRQAGGSAESENAVTLALEWLAAHQLPDGGWCFDHQQGPGRNRTSPNPGVYDKARFGATAMALLTFLGAGQTHKNGDYQEVVEAGLAFLVGPDGGAITNHGLSFHERQGRMYSHGLAAICLCEAYAMTNDSRLFQPAQDSLRFIEYAQDPVGGGWRYEPKEPGDTSVVGWQIMALKSANLGDMHVSEATIRLATKFLDSVASGSGSYYGYTDRNPRLRERALTSIGLLCRMYLGWDRGHPSLVRGVQYLVECGPSVDDWEPGDAKKMSDRAKTEFASKMYYNYYATQVMRHYGGDEWEEWNETMRDFLIETQATDGTSKGSWHFDSPDLGYTTGGRLYTTTLAAMTLEVYYRYLPLYDNELVSEDEFILD